MLQHKVNERAQHLLKILIERYIRDGQPVGSQTLVKEGSVNCSSATVRNVLADLEENGYLRSPHHSAGRIPTAQGYRLFVDSLITSNKLDESLFEDFHQQLNPDQNLDTLITSTSNLLSKISNLASVITIPRCERFVLRQVEFLPLSENRILIILVLNDKEVQNRIIHTKRPYNKQELEQAAKYLNMTFQGQEIVKIRDELLAAMRNDCQQMDEQVRAIINVANEVFYAPNQKEGYVVAGEANLVSRAEETGIEEVKQLLDAFSQKSGIIHLLEQCIEADGVQIFIGEESGYNVLDNYSMITAPYGVEGQVVGVLGVIGPTRMPYERVISIVDVTARLLSVALGSNPK
ncbi:heat-inducible transcriptional repressor HrcA [soil metagenome]